MLAKYKSRITMNSQQKSMTNPFQTQNNAYFCGMKEEKKIDWLFPDRETEVTLEEYKEKVFLDEHSGDISFKAFTERLEALSE